MQADSAVIGPAREGRRTYRWCSTHRNTGVSTCLHSSHALPHDLSPLPVRQALYEAAILDHYVTEQRFYAQEFEGALKIVKVEADPCPNLVEKYKVRDCVRDAAAAKDVLTQQSDAR